MASATPLWEGWLEKAGKVNTQWRRRYCVLQQSGDLDYFKQQPLNTQSPSKGTISLATARGARYMEDHGVLLIVTENRAWLLGFDSPDQQATLLPTLMSKTFPLVEARRDWGDILVSGRMGLKNWRRVHFILFESGDLVMFRDPAMRNLHGLVATDEALRVSSSEDGALPGGLAVLLSLPEQQLKLRFPTVQMAEAWVSTFSGIMGQRQSVHSRGHASIRAMHSTATASGAAADVIAAADDSDRHRSKSSSKAKAKRSKSLEPTDDASALLREMAAAAAGAGAGAASPGVFAEAAKAERKKMDQRARNRAQHTSGGDERTEPRVRSTRRKPRRETTAVDASSPVAQAAAAAAAAEPPPAAAAAAGAAGAAGAKPATKPATKPKRRAQQQAHPQVHQEEEAKPPEAPSPTAKPKKRSARGPRREMTEEERESLHARRRESMAQRPPAVQRQLSLAEEEIAERVERRVAEWAGSKDLVQMLQTLHEVLELRQPIVLAPAAADEEEQTFRGISFSTLRLAYKRVLLRVHPDKLGGATEEYKLLAEGVWARLSPEYEIIAEWVEATT